MKQFLYTAIRFSEDIGEVKFMQHNVPRACFESYQEFKTGLHKATHSDMNTNIYKITDRQNDLNLDK